MTKAKVSIATERLRRELAAVHQHIDWLICPGIVTKVASVDRPLPKVAAVPEAEQSVVQAAAKKIPENLS